jgi:hypothetical protein
MAQEDGTVVSRQWPATVATASAAASSAAHTGGNIIEKTPHDPPASLHQPGLISTARMALRRPSRCS